MPTSNGLTCPILVSKVQGKPVYNMEGEKIGRVEDIVLDTLSNCIEFAVLGCGGILGIGEKYYALPWALLDYNDFVDGYVVYRNSDLLEQAPSYQLEDLIKNDSAIRTETFDRFKTPKYWEQ